MKDSEFTKHMQMIEAGKPEAWDRLIALLYQDLRRIAHTQMTRIDPGHTLSTTILVHEVFEKISARSDLEINDRSHFYAICAIAMRQIIIDHYRRRTSHKRVNSGEAYAEHESRRVTADMDVALTELGRMLELLKLRDERLLKVFEMRFFAGLTNLEIADQLGLSERTVQRMARRARAWIATGLEPGY